jgi:carbon-monoxide dehydrogenase medium subunit
MVVPRSLLQSVEERSVATFRYAAPTKLEDAFSLLCGVACDVAPLAGGTDLINNIRTGVQSPKLVILLRKIRELSGAIQEKQEGVLIGALATLSEIAQHACLRRKFPAITESANLIGSKQIRNRATMVGNICNASPAADTVPALLLYDATISIVGSNGRRSVPVASFVRSPNQTSLTAGEIVESIFVPYSAAPSSSCYVRFSRREGADLAIVGVAAFASVTNEIRLALSSVGPTAFRAYEAENILRQGVEDPAIWERGLAAAVNAASPISDLRASREYRLALIKALTAEAVQCSLSRIRTRGRQ